ncbi:flagellar basal body protein [Mitsuaria sp. GD03876]|uniref:flagellar basal body-associated FliL family protein n=1 Tax=Mitsuaria sp. GD03876 TaxID=2975399 RepID=UPI00244B97C8|nr:flagellar basal body protein [Mitsuaria sp. GD03876]MDH0868344.1 flagellar basal body protein [Mitsuaria sp. GD03876]
MKINIKLIGLVAAVALLAAGGAGAAVWWMKAEAGKPVADAANAKDAKDGKAAKDDGKPAPDYKYVMLDKVLVMLRGPNGAAVSHYMAVDIVFKTLPEQEKRTKDHLPLLRTVAVKALSAHTVESAQAMSVEQFAQLLNRAYAESYATDRREAPFAEALIGKLIIE